jgi:hypothetical protein
MPVHLMLPHKFGRLLFGVWLILMALSDSSAPITIAFRGWHVVLGILIIAAGVFIIVDR